MTNETQNVFYILPHGAVQEEPQPRSWEDIEKMCRAGQLSPESLIWVPQANSWKKVIETELAPLIEAAEAAAREVGPDPAVVAEKTDQYNQIKLQIEGTPDDWELMIQAAELAMSLEDRSAAVAHFQQALQVKPFHPRVIRKIKRTLAPAEWKTLQFFARPEPIWDDVQELATYPLSRGPLYLAIPAVVLFGLSWLPGAVFVIAPLLFLWVSQVSIATAYGDEKPPLWHGLLSDPVGSVLRPLALAVVVAAELYLPFIILAQILALTGSGAESHAFAVLQSSPLLIVTMSALTLVYLPAVIVLAGVSAYDVVPAADPRRVFSAVVKMEGEYVASVAIIGVLLAVWGIIAFVSGFVPFVGRMVAIAVGVFFLVASALVLGRLQSRFKEQLSDLVRRD